MDKHSDEFKDYFNTNEEINEITMETKSEKITLTKVDRVKIFLTLYEQYIATYTSLQRTTLLKNVKMVADVIKSHTEELKSF